MLCGDVNQIQPKLGLHKNQKARKVGEEKKIARLSSKNKKYSALLRLEITTEQYRFQLKQSL